MFSLLYVPISQCASFLQISIANHSFTLLYPVFCLIFSLELKRINCVCFACDHLTVVFQAMWGFYYLSFQYSLRTHCYPFKHSNIPGLYFVLESHYLLSLHPNHMIFKLTLSSDCSFLLKRVSWNIAVGILWSLSLQNFSRDNLYYCCQILNDQQDITT